MGVGTMKLFLMFIMIALLGLGGFAQSAETSPQEVLLVTEHDQVDGCKPLGKITGSSSLGGIAAQKWGKARAEDEMRDKAQRLGANVILVHSSEGGFYGAKAVGDAYLCRPGAPEAGTGKTPSKETPASEQGGCGKDTDCKGDRVCESGRCVNP
jgi:hypothetical protein